MALTLTITSYQSQVLGADGRREFGESGGSVGRAQGNDWVLPDPERYISGQHFTLSCNENAYYLTDTSTNGVFINQLTTPVGNGNSVQLNDGDHLEFGDYEISVSIDDATGDVDPFGAWPGQDVAADADSSAAGVADAGGFPELSDFPDSELPADGDFNILPDKPDVPITTYDEAGAKSDHAPSLEASFQPSTAKSLLRLQAAPPQAFALHVLARWSAYRRRFDLSAHHAEFLLHPHEIP